MKDFGKVSYKPVGHCIYCGADDNLQREHIVPFRLSGTAVLPKSSCGKCAQITRRFEEDVLRGPMWSVRILRQLKSRRKHREAPKTEHLIIKKDGKEQNIELPLEDYPILLHFPVFPIPAYLGLWQYVSGIQISGIMTVSFGPRPEMVMSKLGASQIKMTQDPQPISFARMIAKIAYAYAIAEGAMDFIEGESFVLPSILGEKDEIGKWVGTLSEMPGIFEGLLHRVLIHQDKEKGLLFGEVHLFCDSQTPSYGVILGKLK